MKFAVFSDIHGNYKALNRTLEQIDGKNPDRIIFLGDIFQRGNEEVECLELLKDRGIICIKGNCELYLANGVDIDPDVEYLMEYYDSAREKLSDEQLQFIKQMPLFYETECLGHRILFTHFLFSDVNEAYPYLPLSSLKNGVFDKACESEDIKKYELVVIGHCHQNLVKGNVVSVSASGLEDPSYLFIEVSEDAVHYEHIEISKWSKAYKKNNEKNM